MVGKYCRGRYDGEVLITDLDLDPNIGREEVKMLIQKSAFYQNMCKFCKEFFVSFESLDINQTNCSLDNINQNNCYKPIKECCLNAIDCCADQLFSEAKADFCPLTWDGISCIPAAAKNTTYFFDCPAAIQTVPFIFSGTYQAQKKCQEDATWLSSSSIHYTDYTQCMTYGRDQEKALNLILISFLSITILMLILAIGMILSKKVLRIQSKLIIHLNLMTALLLSGICEFAIAVNLIQYIDDLESPKACLIVINLLMGYFQNTVYAWILLEGVFLQRLLKKAFSNSNSLLWYYLSGWGLPAVLNGILITIRLKSENYNGCWNDESTLLTYIQRTPNVVCILVNFFLLIDILRRIRKTIKQHNESNGIIRLARAAFILMPIFGLYSIIVPFRLLSTNKYFFIYTLIKNIITASQGIAVSIVLCFANREIIGAVFRRFRSIRMSQIDSNKNTLRQSSRNVNNLLQRNTLLNDIN